MTARPLGRFVNTRYSHLISELSIHGPICHVGSLINRPDVTSEMVARWRSNFEGAEPFKFTGIDLFDGPNVDVVADLTNPDFGAEHPELKNKFGLVICRALLEHVSDPFAVARNVQLMIKPGGHLYCSTPWVWGFHAYPDDYWRLSFSALGVLFPELIWVKRFYEGTKEGVGVEHVDSARERKLFQFTEVTSEVGKAISDRAMPYLSITAIGQKPL